MEMHYNFDDDFEAFKQEILESEEPQALQGLMKKLRQIRSYTHVVPMKETDKIRTRRAQQSTWKKKKGSTRDPTAAEIAEENFNKQLAKRKR
ncbi:hypothetical protein Pst134EA_007232 [Puccinia striiformis f. sp. tritici]|nr:hypothetical protein Pst134EA_007232 [Puccinia striiformis f. sp. tritici]KAH9469961.1 hypothetical protein Pst134EA_007232 [Puccinia striiformis f. sp. tritici]